MFSFPMHYNAGRGNEIIKNIETKNQQVMVRYSSDHKAEIIKSKIYGSFKVCCASSEVAAGNISLKLVPAAPWRANNPDSI